MSAGGAPFEVPQQVVVRGRAWRVLSERELDPALPHHRLSLRALRRDTLGYTFRAWGEVHLSSRHRSRRQRCATLLHELVHACSASSAYSHLAEERFARAVELRLLRALEALAPAERLMDVGHMAGLLAACAVAGGLDEGTAAAVAEDVAGPLLACLSQLEWRD